MLNNCSIAILVIAFTILNTGCGKSKSNEDLEMANSATQENIFPETVFEPIDFSPTQRSFPTSVEDATASLDAIRSLFDWNNIPAALNSDVSTASTYQYITAWKLLNDQLPHDIAWLKELDGKSVHGADNIAIQKIDNAAKGQLDWLENRFPSKMEFSAKHTRRFLEQCVDPMKWNHIEKAADCDMTDSNQVSNLLGRQNINQLRAEQIQKVAVAYESLTFFDDLMGIDSDWAPKKKVFRDIVLRYQEKLGQAAEAIQPPSEIGDKELMQIAAKVLANEQYELPNPERIIVNSPKKSFGKDHFTIDFGERSIEKSPYRWEEFQVATIEKEGDQYYLWYNTIMFYSVGPHTVPTEKWVLGPRHKSAPISEKNINN